jgi:hypothetical protein
LKTAQAWPATDEGFRTRAQNGGRRKESLIASRGDQMDQPAATGVGAEEMANNRSSRLDVKGGHVFDDD